MRTLRIGLLAAAPLLAWQDPGKQLNSLLGEKTGKRVQLSFEMRQRSESRTGLLFGRDRDIAADFLRLRFGMAVKPVKWLKVSALAQDARVVGYGLPPPSNVKDPLDLQEAYIEMFSEKQLGFGATIGRQMLNYGDTRLIGSPQWAYTARTWDTARLYWVSKKMRLEFVSLSPVVTRGNGFNQPVLGDRVWGTYSTFKDVLVKSVADVYILRHDQNRPGGFTGIGRLGINVFGSRWAIPLPRSFRVTLEGVLQNGKVGPLPHRAAGGVVQIGYKTTMFGKPLDFANEYKYASGTNPDSGRSGTFDQLYPAAHDKLGHVDLIGWRNVHNIRSITTYTPRKQWNIVLMYNSTWLADPRDALYNLQSRPIARSAAGTAGRYVGQEADLYFTYAFHGVTVGAGAGQFIPGTFIRNATPGAHSRLLYLSLAYSF